MLADLVRFGDFELNTRTGELRSAGRFLKLQPQPAKVLGVLVERAGQLVTREELQSAVWGNSTVVDYENGLNWSVRKIREMLGDDPLKPKFIETVPKKGYRFVAQIVGPAVDPISVPGRRFIPILVGSVLIIVCLVLIGGGFLLRQQHRRAAQQTTVVVLPFDNLTGQTDRDYLAVAGTDQVITGIGINGSLNVIDRATATKMKRTEECIIRIGELLRADFVVQGSLVGPPQAPLITAGIYRVRDNTKLWAAQLPAGADSGMSAYRVIAAKVGEIAR